MSNEQTPKQQCEALGISVYRNEMYAQDRFTYLGVFPPGRSWPTEEAACIAALAHYWAIQPEQG
jgi:hypothetical protein